MLGQQQALSLGPRLGRAGHHLGQLEAGHHVRNPDQPLAVDLLASASLSGWSAITIAATAWVWSM